LNGALRTVFFRGESIRFRLKAFNKNVRSFSLQHFARNVALWGTSAKMEHVRGWNSVAANSPDEEVHLRFNRETYRLGYISI